MYASHLRFGIDRRELAFRVQSWREEPREKDYSDETAREIDVALKELIEDSYVRAKALLLEHRPLLDQGARLLLEKETLTPEDFPPPARGDEPPGVGRVAAPA